LICSKSLLFCLKSNSFYSKTRLFCPAIQFKAVKDRRLQAGRGRSKTLRLGSERASPLTARPPPSCRRGGTAQGQKPEGAIFPAIFHFLAIFRQKWKLLPINPVSQIR
jgi:hypothetical protein